MSNTISEYRLLARDLPKTLARHAREPEIRREIEYYERNISKIKSIDDFLGNQRIYNFAMAAFGMKDMIFAKAMIKKILSEGIDNPSSFAFSLADPRFREFAQTFNFKSLGPSTTAFDRAQRGTVDKFLRNTLEEKAGKSNEAIRLALYFDRKAPEISTEYGILADKAIYAVVRRALGLPDAIASADIDKQAKLLSGHSVVSQFSDPAKRNAFISRFLALSDAATSSQSESQILSLVSGTAARVEMNTLLSLQSLRRFGS